MFGSIHDREEYDYRAGLASELENAYALSCMERPSDDSAKINFLVNAGKFVVVEEVPAFCPRTDASMGCSKWIRGHFDSPEGAEGCLSVLMEDSCPDCSLYILPRSSVPAASAPRGDDNEIPF